MEVHAHTHAHGKKSWKSYFWEFLMLFLAVFCGFLAENQREHMIEHNREKEYMATMLEDLRADIPLLESTIRDWKVVNLSIDSVTKAITFPITGIDFLKVYRHLNLALNYWGFKYNDRTLTQLKNAGGFRLIRNKTVANKLIAYDQFNNDAIVNIAYQHNQLYLNTIALRSKIFSEEVISEIFALYSINTVPYSFNPHLDSMLKKTMIPVETKNNNVLLFEFKNSLITLKRDYEGNMAWGYEHIRQYNGELIKLIQDEYHLK